MLYDFLNEERYFYDYNYFFRIIRFFSIVPKTKNEKKIHNE